MNAREQNTMWRVSAALSKYAAQMCARSAAGESGAEFAAVLADAIAAADDARNEALRASLDAGSIILGDNGARVEFAPRETWGARESTYALAYDVDEQRAGAYRKIRAKIEKANALREDAALITAMTVADVYVDVADDAGDDAADCALCARVSRYGTRCRRHSR